ncbi:MAG: MATE family efflux transporter [Spirochaetota bacterium]|nr:MAG: MATE family efflux transporter [Spirochaetota bacterium]
MLIGIIGMVAFNLVDTFFVGRLGALELAAMSFTFPVVLVIISISQGLGVGASSVLSRAIGEGDQHKVKRITTDSLVLSFSIVVVFVIAGMLTIEPLFRLLGADDNILPLIKDYMRIWYIGVPFVIIPMVGNSAIRATGDTTTPSIIMVVAICVNLVLDPLLIFGIGPFPRWELAGAAVATVIARAVTMVLSLFILGRRERMLTTEVPSLKEILESWKKILYIGLPAAGTYIIIPLSMGVITRLVASFGPESVAGFGVATRIETFALTQIIALSVVLIPFIGQNMGAGKYERIRKGLKYSQLFALIWGLVLFLIFIFTARQFAGVFNKNSSVIESTALYLLIVSVSYGAQGVFQLVSSAFNAINKPFPAAILALVRMFGLYIPLALLGSRIFGLRGIFAAASAANLVIGAVSFIWIGKMLKSMSLNVNHKESLKIVSAQELKTVETN